MSDSAAALIKKEYLNSHENMLAYLQKLSDEQIQWRPSAETHSIAWHIWHVTRWADYFQACMFGMRPELSKRFASGVQIWETEDYAKHWGFDNADLGFAATGMAMPDDVALRLPFPPKAELLTYMERALAESGRVVKAIDDDEVGAVEPSQPLPEEVWGEGGVGDVLFVHITHINRHLGMMECLLGLQGQHGTATI